jgi:hypothetical protein
LTSSGPMGTDFAATATPLDVVPLPSFMNRTGSNGRNHLPGSMSCRAADEFDLTVGERAMPAGRSVCRPLIDAHPEPSRRETACLLRLVCARRDPTSVGAPHRHCARSRSPGSTPIRPFTGASSRCSRS